MSYRAVLNAMTCDLCDAQVVPTPAEEAPPAAPIIQVRSTTVGGVQSSQHCMPQPVSVSVSLLRLLMQLQAHVYASRHTLDMLPHAAVLMTAQHARCIHTETNHNFRLDLHIHTAVSATPCRR